LLPERSTSYEIGGDILASWIGEHAVQLSLFRTDMNDRIVWVPAGGFSVTPKNIRSVESTGIESSYSWSPPGTGMMLDVNYTFVKP
jgi:outer membrane receptor for ferrienterochelin and colicin